MNFFRTIIQMKIKFLSSFIHQYSSEHSSQSDAYLDYLKARRFEFKAMYQARDTIDPFYNLNLSLSSATPYLPIANKDEEFKNKLYETVN